MLLLSTLGGCFSAFESTRGAHSQHQTAARSVEPGEYRVVGGDTLYSIAFRNQLDFHDLASWNRISGPDYRIYPGRILRLRAPGVTTSVSAARKSEDAVASYPPPATPTGNGGANPYGRGAGSSGKSSAGADSAAGSAGNADAATSGVSVPPDSAPPPRLPKPTSSAVVAPPGPRFDAGRWEWPTQGRVLRSFGADGSKGVDIGGNLGQIVVAAAAGKVVYSGSALKGYGELVILKHDEQYLSAYGFNQRRLVNEGDVVGAGQPIAELGLGPEQKPELHFEIRDRGRPIDPLSQLPRR